VYGSRGYLQESLWIEESQVFVIGWQRAGRRSGIIIKRDNTEEFGVSCGRLMVYRILPCGMNKRED
jgi:hypothetical protein